MSLIRILIKLCEYNSIGLRFLLYIGELKKRVESGRTPEWDSFLGIYRGHNALGKALRISRYTIDNTYAAEPDDNHKQRHIFLFSDGNVFIIALVVSNNSCKEFN